MAKFYVGQRVKVARRTHDCDLLTGPKAPTPNLRVGLEGTILGTESQPNAGFVVHPLVELVSMHVDAFGAYGMIPASCLEPLVPPHEVCDTEFKATLDELLARQAVGA